MKTVEMRTIIIVERDVQNLRSIIDVLVQEHECEDVFTFVNEDNSIGNILIGVSDYAVDCIDSTINTIEIQFENDEDGFLEDVNGIYEADIPYIQDLANLMHKLNDGNKNAITKTSLEYGEVI